MTNTRSCEPGQYLLELVFPGLTPSNVLAAIAVIGVTLCICYMTGLLSKSAFIFLLIVFLLISSPIAGWLLVTGRFNCFVMKNYDVVEQPIILENLTMRFTDEAVNFVRANKDSPFLLYMSFAKVHTALFNTRPFVNHSVHGRYGDNVEEMDWSVGQIMAAVEKLGLKDNTFVYFTSDNGPHLEEINSGEYHGGWKGIYKGGKMRRLLQTPLYHISNLILSHFTSPFITLHIPFYHTSHHILSLLTSHLSHFKSHFNPLHILLYHT